MTFFNKKEDVMKIELTPYGRGLMSNGEFKPQYYAFFDDDIIYDSEAGGYSENNSETKIRILTQTPSLKPQTTLSGVESRSSNISNAEKDNILLNPIGTNLYSSKQANGWEVTAVLGEFSSSLGYISSSLSPIYNIPQIECELNFTMSVGDSTYDKYSSFDIGVSQLAEDSTFLKLEQENLLLHMLEKNGFTYKDSLLLEVYMYDYDEIAFNKLEFQENVNIEADIVELSSAEEDPQYVGDTGMSFGEDVVENYFLIRRDRQIPNSMLCRGLKKLKENNIFLREDINCEDIEDEEVNIYQTSVTDIEDCE